MFWLKIFSINGTKYTPVYNLLEKPAKNCFLEVRRVRTYVRKCLYKQNASLMHHYYHCTVRTRYVRGSCLSIT